MVVEIESFINGMGGDSLVLGFSVIACIVSVSVLLHSNKKTQKISQKLLRLERELHVAQGSAIGMGQQLIILEKQLSQQAVPRSKSSVTQQGSTKINSNELETKSLIDNNKNDSVYDQARQALAQGLSVGDVAKQSGLSFAEVSLLQSLSKSTISSY